VIIAVCNHKLKGVFMIEYHGIIEFIIFVFILVLITKPLGTYIKKVVTGEKTFFDRIARPIEKSIYKICRIDSNNEQNWKQYTVSLLLFSFFGFVFLFLMQYFQHYLPLNPEKLKNVPAWLSFNTTASFVTNTNWQAYSGESTLGYLVQMAGLAVQNFVSGASGIAVVIALTRAFVRKNTDMLGNFWVDLTRIILWILLPISVIVSIFFIAQGIPQNISHYIVANTIDAGRQIIPQGPVATQEVIKSLGTNGGGFFGVNSMHPYENPNALTNFVQCLCIFSIPAALTYTFGLMVNRKKQGWTIFIVMLIMFVALSVTMYTADYRGNPEINKITQVQHNSSNIVPNMEGKEARLGVSSTLLYADVTTSASDGGVSGAMENLNPISGGVAMFNMALGEVIMGGVGTGLYNMLMFVLLTVFIAGLMVGRSPEFLGKKLGVTEMKWVMVALLVSPFCAIFFTALACALPSVSKELTTYGPHGFSRILYAFISAANNNGSSFSYLNANTDFFNITTGLAMIFGRFISIIAIMIVAGSIVKKKIVPETSGTFPTTGAIFVVMLIVCILIIGGLTFFPALALGPIAEHLMLF
jgi:potassium-transporting ATPase potassium-binding subunit